MLLVAPAAAEDAVREKSTPVRIRLEWGGGKPRMWSGLLEVSEGRLENPVSLGVEADEPSAIGTNDGSVWMQRRAEGVYDGFDVTVVAPATAKIILTLQSPEPNPSRERIELPIAKIGAFLSAIPIGQSGARLAVRRAPGDALAVRLERSHVIYRPGETFAVKVSPNIPQADWKEDSHELVWTLASARSDTARATGRIPVSVRGGRPQDIPLSIVLPSEEGVYDVTLRLDSSSIYQSYAPSILESYSSMVQVVVLSPDGDPERLDLSERNRATVVDSFRPDAVNLMRRVSKRRTLRRLNDAFGNLFGGGSDAHVASAAGEPGTKVDWRAYRLSVKNPGRPHRLVVTVPGTGSQQVGISLLEPNVAGQLMPIGLDAGLIVDAKSSLSTASNASAQSGSFQHELLFWPKIRQPIVLLHDFGSGRAIDVNSVEVQEVRTSPLSAEKSISAESLAPKRLVGPYLHRPLLPENFGASEAYDEQSQRSLDDWVTFHTAARRLEQYLKAHGYNSLMLSVFADGSSIYPSRLLQPTPRYDTGAHFATGQDPMRKDVLELLYRMFDREELALVPELQFSTPLPELERQIASGDAPGIELVGRDGRTWRESMPYGRGLAPYYNPLDSRVQTAILNVVDEFVERYATHASFAGLAIELSNRGYMVLPGMEWGYDDTTVARFEDATHIRVPGGTGAERFEQRFAFLNEQQSEAWNQWRTEQLAAFYGRLTARVTKAKAEAKLVLSAPQLRPRQSSDVNPRPMARSRRKHAAPFRANGIDFELLENQSGLVVLRPPPGVVAGNGTDVEYVDTSFWNMAAQGCPQGSLLWHQIQECRVAEFDSISPWQPAFTWLVAQTSPTGQITRKQYASSLATSDSMMVFEGGWRPPFGQETHTRAIRDLITSLPAIPFHRNNIQHQPALVRVARDRDQTWIYVVNELGHETHIKLRLSSGPNVVARRLPDRTSIQLTSDEEGGSTVLVKLGPYEAWACEVIDPRCRITDVVSEVSSSALANIESAIRQFDEKIGDLRLPRKTVGPVALNPGFEAPATKAGRIPGWDLAVRNADSWAIDGDNPRSGNSSLLLVSGHQSSTSLMSDVPLEGTRLLTMSLWLRSDRADADVRLAFEASVDGRPHVRHMNVDVDDVWRQYRFRVTDIPLDRLENAKVRVEIRGEGKVWVDDVDIQARRLTRDDLRRLTKVSASVSIAWNEKRYADCEKLLQGYWAQLVLDEPTSEKPASQKPTGAVSRFRRLFLR